MARFVALLRGINVGGQNLIKMSALKLCFEEHGFQSVATYIQSGNVLFTSGESARPKLTRRIEAMLSSNFNYRASVLLRNQPQMQHIVARAPQGFGDEPGKYRYDVLFLKEPLKAAIAVKRLPTAPGVDEAHAGTGVIYFSRLIDKAAQSQLSKVTSLPIYKSMTIRNWKTTTKLESMLGHMEV